MSLKKKINIERNYISMNNYILDLLNIKDKNIKIDERSDIKKKKRKNIKILYGTLSYNPEYCPKCGCINEGYKDVIKWGFKNCIIKIPKVSNLCTELYLKKQRFYCKNCNDTFISETNLVDKNKNISNNLNLQIRLDLMEKSSEKDIANRNNVSSSSVNRIMDDISKKTILRHQSLPISMNWDEFKATNDTKGKMAFIIVNNKTGETFDILDSRKSRDLELYFRRYPKRERDKVKFICMDFYIGYINLAKRLFKNAKIIIDRFHIITQVYQALNSVRISLCHKSNPHYNKLKDYWKLILKDEFKLDNKSKFYSKHFHKEVTQKYIVDFLINTNKELKSVYNVYQGILHSISNKDFNKFKSIIYNNRFNHINKLHNAFITYKQNINYIENAINYDINNGVIEGTNNLIKCIKRIAFGYRKFKHFISRIFLIKGMIKG